MKENRRFLRVNYLGSAWLHYDQSRYNCRFENISKKGALVCLKKLPDAPLDEGGRCRLMLHQEDMEQQYQEFDAKILRFKSEVAALEFTESAIASDEILENLVRKELCFINGGKKLIDLSRKIARRKGVTLKFIYFDNGELNLEREIHTLRLSGETDHQTALAS